MKNTTIKMTEIDVLKAVYENPSEEINKEFAKIFKQKMDNILADKDSKAAPKQLENKAISNKIVEYLTKVNRPLAITEIADYIKDCQDWIEPINLQRISRIIANLKEEGQIHREMQGEIGIFFVR